jgi:galactose mutarotase-like enzyme
MIFEVLEKSKNSVSFSLNSSEETRKMYPFEFELQIIYTLEEYKLHIDYKVINKGKSEMPFSIGAHPAFALNGNFENYTIEFEKEENLEYYLLENDLISKKKKQLEINNKITKLSII